MNHDIGIHAIAWLYFEVTKHATLNWDQNNVDRVTFLSEVQKFYKVIMQNQKKEKKKRGRKKEKKRKTKKNKEKIKERKKKRTNKGKKAKVIW